MHSLFLQENATIFAVTRIARWYILKQKIPFWVNFGWLLMEDVGIFYGHLVDLRQIGKVYGQ
jgi:hypothetical protein